METPGLAVMRLVRRIGLAIALYIVFANLPSPYNNNGLAIGMAVLGFFLPRVESTSFESKEK